MHTWSLSLWHNHDSYTGRCLTQPWYVQRSMVTNKICCWVQVGHFVSLRWTSSGGKVAKCNPILSCCHLGVVRVAKKGVRWLAIWWHQNWGNLVLKNSSLKLRLPLMGSQIHVVGFVFGLGISGHGFCQLLCTHGYDSLELVKANSWPHVHLLHHVPHYILLVLTFKHFVLS